VAPCGERATASSAGFARSEKRRHGRGPLHTECYAAAMLQTGNQLVVIAGLNFGISKGSIFSQQRVGGFGICSDKCAFLTKNMVMQRPIFVGIFAPKNLLGTARRWNKNGNRCKKRHPVAFCKNTAKCANVSTLEHHFKD
jgi:hypothetical protein